MTCSLRPVVAGAALLLSACGGGGGGSDAGAAGEAAAGLARGGCAAEQTLSATPRNDGLRIVQVDWLQTVAQSADGSDVQLAGGKPVQVRVDLVANQSQLAPTRAELRIRDGAECAIVPLRGPDRVPTAAGRDTASLATAFVADIPSALVRPGLSVTVVFDDGQGRTAAEAESLRRTFAPAVTAPITEQLLVVPLIHRDEVGYVRSLPDLERLLVRLHPIAGVRARLTEPFAAPSLQGGGNGGLLGLLGGGGGGQTNASFMTMNQLLDEVDEYCAAQGGRTSRPVTSTKCLGVFPDNIRFTTPLNPSGRIVGLAELGGTTMLAESLAAVDDGTVTSPYASRHWLTFRAVTVAHEYGHLLALEHANCGTSSGIDPRLYPDGRLGGLAGHDAERGFYFSSAVRSVTGQPQFGDLMSYCEKEWSSDRGYRASLRYRAQLDERRSRREAAPRWLRLTPVPDGWRLRWVAFPPDVLVPTAWTLGLEGMPGVSELAVASAVLPDVPEGSPMPLYVPVPAGQPTALRLLAQGRVQAQWAGETLESLFQADKR